MRVCPLVFMLVLWGAAAAGAEVALVGVGRATAWEGRVHPRARIQFRHQPGLALPADPRCPAASSLQLSTSASAAAGVALPCTGWRAHGSGYRYSDPTAAAGGVRKVVLKPGRLLVRLSGAAFGGVEGPVDFVQARLRIGGESYCGRFERFAANRLRRVAALGPASGCPPPPNVIVINLDDVRADGLSQMTQVQERLVPLSVRFSNSFAPNPICNPSRASLFSGLRTPHHGVLTLSGALGGADRFRESGAEQETIATWFDRAGYHTGLAGKYLNAYDFGSEDPDGDGRLHVPPGWDDWFAVRSAEFYGGANGRTWYEIQRDGSPITMVGYEGLSPPANAELTYQVDVGARRLLQMVEAARRRDERFFLYWGPIAAHGGYNTLPIPAARHLGVFAALPVPEPPSWFEEDRSDKPQHMQALALGALDLALTRAAYRRQHEALLAVDEAIGELLDLLDETLVPDGRGGLEPLRRQTILVLTSDNGVTLGENHLRFLTKAFPYEGAQRVPLLVKTASEEPVGEREEIALTYDLAPTLVDLAGLPLPPGLDGRSLAPLLRGEASPAPWRSDYLMEHVRVSQPGPYPGGTVLPDYVGVNDPTRGLKYVHYLDTDEIELYDLVADPWELDSLCEGRSILPLCEPAALPLQAEMAERLAELLGP